MREKILEEEKMREAYSPTGVGAGWRPRANEVRIVHCVPGHRPCTGQTNDCTSNGGMV
jgi:hypothetical protein